MKKLLLITVLSSSFALSANSSELGCKFFLCIAGGVQSGGAVCVATVNEVIRDFFKKGKSAPSCKEAEKSGSYKIASYEAEERLTCPEGKGKLTFFKNRGKYTCGEIRSVWDTETGTYKQEFVKLARPTVIMPYTKYMEYDFGHLTASQKNIYERYIEKNQIELEEQELHEGVQRIPMEVNYRGYFDPTGEHIAF